MLFSLHIFMQRTVVENEEIWTKDTRDIFALCKFLSGLDHRSMNFLTTVRVNREEVTLSKKLTKVIPALTYDVTNVQSHLIQAKLFL